MKENELNETIVNVGGQAIEVMRAYFNNEEEDDTRADKALRMLTHSTKIMHMNLVRTNSERGHAIQLLKYLPDQEVRDAYIKLTNPTVGEVLENRPKTKSKNKK